MKKKILTFLLTLCLALPCGLFLSACGEHTHAFGETWTSDETGHWHACSGCDEKDSFAEHEYDDICDESCNICGYMREGHNYDSDGQCTICNKTYGLQYEYAQNWDGTEYYSLSGVTSLRSGDIIVASSYDDDVHGVLPVTRIKDTALAGNTQITSIVVPSSVTDIEYRALQGCDSLTSLKLPFVGISVDSVRYGDKKEFYNIFGGLSYIPESLKHVEITGDNEIGGSAFSRCTTLETISITGNVGKIGGSAFNGCTSLKSVEITGEVTGFGSYLFQECTSLTSVTWPQNSFTLDIGTYYGCTGLTMVSLLNGIISVPERTFHNCTNLTSVVIPSTVTKVEFNAFRGCSSLTSINMPNVSTIEWYAFYDCTNLANVSMPNVESIGERAFYNSGITSIEALKIKTINDYAFGKCSNLKNVKLGPNAEAFGKKIFVDNSTIESAQLPFVGASKTDTENTLVYLFGTEESSSASDQKVPTSLKTLVLDGGDQLPNRAVKYCKGIEDVTISSSFETIGNEAFIGCTNLKTITINAPITKISDGMFYWCENLTTINVSGDISIIGREAFIGCDSITAIPDLGKIENINSYAFKNSGIVNAVIPNTVTSMGWGVFEKCENLTSATISTALETIPVSTFQECTSLTEFTIPEHISSIGSDVFRLCTNLTKVTLSSKITVIPSSAFRATGLTSFTVPSGITEVGMYAFDECTSLTSLSIPNSVTTLGTGFVYGCSALTSLTIPFFEETKDVKKWLFGSDTTPVLETLNVTNASYMPNFKNWSLKSVSIDGPITTIDKETFYRCTNLTSVSLPKNITSIGEDAFYMTKIASITLPEKLTSIGEYAFRYCTELTSIKIPEGVTSINVSVFSNCSKLQSVSLSEKTTEIGSYAFVSCTALTTINLPSGLKTIGHDALSETRLTEVVIPESVETVDSNAFEGCSELVSATISGLIKSYAFKDCPKLANVTIRSDVTTIGEQAFSNTGIETITLPDSITSVGNKAFSNCSKLKSVLVSGNITTWGTSVFYNTNVESLTIPSLSKKLSSICSNSSLKTVTITESVDIIDEAFSGVSVVTINLPAGIKNIGNKAFYGCSKLAELVIPDSVETFGTEVLAGCTSLIKLTIPHYGATLDATDTYFGYLFGATEYGQNTETIPTSLKNVVVNGAITLYAWAFAGCTSLTDLTFTKTVVANDSALTGCTNLSKLTMVDMGGLTRFKRIFNKAVLEYDCPTSYTLEFTGITKIGENGLSEVDGLTHLILPDGVTKLDNLAIWECPDLITITIGDGITSIGETAIGLCQNLMTINLGENGGKYYIENNCLIEKESKTVLIGFGEAVIPSDGSVEVLGYRAFCLNTTIKSINIPASVTNIGRFALTYCYNLESITVDSNNTVYKGIGNCLIKDNELLFGCKNSVIPDDAGLTTIGYMAFEGIPINRVVIPEGVTVIGQYAFKDCTSLEYVYIPETLETVKHAIFENCTALRIIVIMCDASDLTFEKDIDIDEYNKQCNPFKGCTYKEKLIYIKSEYTNYGATAASSLWDNMPNKGFAKWYLYSEEVPTTTNYNYWHYVDGVETIWDVNIES